MFSNIVYRFFFFHYSNRKILSVLIIWKLSHFWKTICEKWKFYKNLVCWKLIVCWKEIDWRFTNHKPLIPTLPYTILPLFFMLPLDQLFEALLRGQPYPPVLITCVLLILTRRSSGASWWGWVPKPGRASNRIEQGTFWY